MSLYRSDRTVSTSSNVSYNSMLSDYNVDYSEHIYNLEKKVEELGLILNHVLRHLGEVEHNKTVNSQPTGFDLLDLFMDDNKYTSYNHVNSEPAEYNCGEYNHIDTSVTNNTIIESDNNQHNEVMELYSFPESSKMDIDTETQEQQKITQPDTFVDVNSETAPECVPFTLFTDSPFHYFSCKELEKCTDFIGYNNREVCYYGDFPYSYGNILHPPKPTSSNPYVESIANYLKIVLPHANFNSILITRYSDGYQNLPPHSDNEDCIVENSEIYSVSLGASREMSFKNLQTGIQSIITLEHGDLLTMTTESQHYFSHAIPSDSSCYNIRVNLTFRLIKETDVGEELFENTNVSNDPITINQDTATNSKQAEMDEHIKHTTHVKTRENVLYISSSMFRYLKAKKLCSNKQSATVFSYRGSTVSGIQSNLNKDDKFLNIDPDSVTKIFLLAGTNNVTNIYFGKDKLGQTNKHLSELTQYLTERFPKSVINVINLFPRQRKGENDVVKEVNVYLGELCCRNDRLNYIETEAKNHLFSSKTGIMKRQFFYDNVHLSNSGIARLGKMLKYISHNL